MRHEASFFTTAGLVALLGTGTALPTALPSQRIFLGEVVRVDAGQKLVTVRTDGGHPSAVSEYRITVRVPDESVLHGISSLEELEKGAPVRIEANKPPLSRIWVADHLAPVAQAGERGLNPVEKAELHRIENAAAHGEMGDAEYETRRQTLMPGARIEF